MDEIKRMKEVKKRKGREGTGVRNEKSTMAKDWARWEAAQRRSSSLRRRWPSSFGTRATRAALSKETSADAGRFRRSSLIPGKYIRIREKGREKGNILRFEKDLKERRLKGKKGSRMAPCLS